MRGFRPQTGEGRERRIACCWPFSGSSYPNCIPDEGKVDQLADLPSHRRRPRHLTDREGCDGMCGVDQLFLAVFLLRELEEELSDGAKHLFREGCELLSVFARLELRAEHVRDPM